MSQAASDARSRLTLVAAVGFAVASGISVIAGLGWITNQLILAQIGPAFLPMAPFAIASFLLLCASYSLYDWRPDFFWVRMVAGAGALIVAILTSLTVIHVATGAGPDLEEMILPNLGILRGYTIVNISPIAALLLFLGGLLFILLVAIPSRAMRNCTAVGGMLIIFSGFVMTVGYTYNVPLLYGSIIRPVAFPAALGFVFLGIGIWMSAGPECWPTCNLIGDSVRARLSRAFLPVTSLVLAFFLLLQALVVQNLAAAPLVGSLALLISLPVMIVVISRMARTIGADIDRTIALRKQAEERLSRTLGQLEKSESQLRAHSEHLQELVEERTRGLSESEKRFRELAELLPGIVFETSANGNFTFMNRFGFSLTGYSIEDLNGGLNWLQLYAPQERDAAEKHLRSTLAGDILRAHEHTVMRKDGSTFPVIVHSAPIMQEGRPLGVRGIAIDISERKRTELELAKSRRLAAIGETAAIIGHDLRNPLQGISTATHLLKKKLESTSDEGTKRMLSTIDKGVEHSESIIRGLLDYSREMNLEVSEHDSESLTVEALSLVKVPANVKVLNLTENQPKMKVDGQKITRVFVNIIQNAIEAMPEGGTLTVSTRQSNGNLETAFSDTGVGMTEEVMGQIWTPLFTTKSRGIGLGLPASRRIVEAHQGSIFVESTPGKGSTFIVRLPLVLKAEV